MVGQIKKELAEVNQIHAQAKTRDDYLCRIDEERILEKVTDYEQLLGALKENRLFDENFLKQESEDLCRCKTTIKDYNLSYIKRKEEEYAELFRLRFPLDEEQRQAVITDDKYKLVIAGARSGKMEVLINRIISLTNKKPAVQPSRILAIAFQKKAVDEIERRLKIYGVGGVHVMTFHKLGKDLLVEASGKDSPRIMRENNFPAVITLLYQKMAKGDPSYLRKVIHYIQAFRDCDEKEDPERMGEDYAEKRFSSYKTLSNTRVKSRAEKEIMDFLLMHTINGNSIRVEYEPTIELNQGDPPSFNPDFYLPDFDLYIEHWALNEEPQAPAWGIL